MYLNQLEKTFQIDFKQYNYSLLSIYILMKYFYSALVKPSKKIRETQAFQDNIIYLNNLMKKKLIMLQNF